MDLTFINLAPLVTGVTDVVAANFGYILAIAGILLAVRIINAVRRSMTR